MSTLCTLILSSAPHCVLIHACNPNMVCEDPHQTRVHEIYEGLHSPKEERSSEGLSESWRLEASHLRRRLRAAGVFLVDSADRRAALPEWE